MKKIITTLAATALLMPVCTIAQQRLQTKTFFSGSIEAQKLKDTIPVIGRVFYQLQYVPDTAKRDSSVTEIMELDFGKTASMFTSFSRKQNDSLMKKSMEEQIAKYFDKNGQIPENTHMNLDMRNVPGLSKSITRDNYYTQQQDKKTEVIQIRNIASSILLTKDTAPQIQWTILDSTKDIQGHLCQKATGESHGRTYTAWFCADLPYSFGPRRLNGLPGLILEAYDDTHEVVYTLQSFTDNVSGKQIGLPADGIDATPAEYNKTKTAFDKNPMAFINSGLSSSTGGATISDVKVIQATSTFSGDDKNTLIKAKKAAINNSIDLK